MTMPVGPGKYDDQLTKIREEIDFDLGILFIIGGNQGDGFSSQCNADYLGDIPKILRKVADEIEDSVENDQDEIVKQLRRRKRGR